MARDEVDRARYASSVQKTVHALTRLHFVLMPLVGKRPIISNWNHLKSTPSDMKVFSERNVGVITGKISGITVLDIDVKEQGMAAWQRLSKSFPMIETPCVRTPSGGLHIYFKYNKKLKSFSRFSLRGNRIGWDLLNDDRQAVLPPSRIEKKKYRWIISPETTQLSRMPKWLEDYLTNCKSFS